MHGIAHVIVSKIKLYKPKTKIRKTLNKRSLSIRHSLNSYKGAKAHTQTKVKFKLPCLSFINNLFKKTTTCN